MPSLQTLEVPGVKDETAACYEWTVNAATEAPSCHSEGMTGSL